MPNIPFWKHPITTILWWVAVWIGLSIVVLFTPPVTINLPVGGDPITGMRDYDAPYLDGFWPAEPRPWHPAMGNALRWSQADWQIHWPHAGSGWWLMQFRTDLSGKPAHTPTQLTWHNPAIGTTMLPSDQRITRVLVQNNQNDTPQINVSTETFDPNGDARTLGIAVTAIQLQPLGGIWRPTLLLAFLLVNLFGRWIINHRIGIIIPFVTGIIWVCFPAWIALHSELLIALSLCSWGIGAGVHWIAQRWHYDIQAMPRVVIGMVWVQLLALWSPFTHSSDIAMHVRMLNQVLSGQLLFTAQLPCEASAYISPYPPLTYILMAPLALISHNGSYQRLLLTGGAVILQAIALSYSYNVLRQQQLPFRAGILFLMLAFINAPLIRAIHVGELSNAWGQSIALIAMSCWIDRHATRQRKIIWTTMALLSHTGVSVSLAMMLGLFAGFQFFNNRHIPRWLIWSGVGMVVMVVGVYYSNFAYLIGQAPGYAGCPPVIPIAMRFNGIVNVFPTIIMCWAGIGLVVFPKSPVRIWVGAGLGAALCSIAMLFFATQTVRWSIAVEPFVALAAAYGLHRVWRYGRAGKILLITTIIWYGVFWYSGLWQSIMVYLHD
jgi:hypothetical protein